MIRKRAILLTLLSSTRGQSWVETVVMLLLIVPLLLGLFFLHDLATTRIRAIQAARMVVWESDWYGREDRPNRAMKLQTQAEWITRLKQVGLGFGLSNVDVFKRNVRQYMTDIG